MIHSARCLARRLVAGVLCSALVACAVPESGSGDDEDAIGRGGERGSEDSGTTARDTGLSTGVDAGTEADSGTPTAPDAGDDTATAEDTALGDAATADALPGPDSTPSDATGSDTAAPDTVTPDAGEPCISETFEPGAIVRPVDIIWAIDASPSMDDEIARIEAQMNDFAQRIGASGLDYRVVVIGSDREQYLPAEAHRFNEICIPPPLSAAPTCPDVDSERYLHVREPIHSKEALAESITTFAEYRSFLRPTAIKHFIYVTDDDERRASAADDFRALVRAESVLGDRVYVHSIVDFIGYDPNCFLDDNCSCGDARGEVYLGLTEETGGLSASLCEDDWTPIFDALEERVTDAVEVPCEFIVPDPGDRYDVDYGEVIVRKLAGVSSDVPRVADASACTAAGGWYFDNPRAPTRLLLCPASCGDTGFGIEVELECFREKV